ncbi:hypothetical protein CR513_42158, partial [Mucuna pruriens]
MSDRGDEFYGKFNEGGQCPSPFTKFLENLGICAQYTMLGTPQQNDVAEKRNRTLITIPLSLWMHALKVVVYLLNKVSNKVYNPREKKFDARTISGFFIDYPEKCNDYIFYCPNHGTRIVECGNSRFIENCQFSGSKKSQKTKRDSKGNIERYKARLIAKGFIQKDGIDYKETFSLVSKKDPLRIVLALIAHYDLALHQMDVKTTFMNGDLEEKVYMDQPKGYENNPRIDHWKAAKKVYHPRHSLAMSKG